MPQKCPKIPGEGDHLKTLWVRKHVLNFEEKGDVFNLSQRP